jgi:hypothetical protein
LGETTAERVTCGVKLGPAEEFVLGQLLLSQILCDKRIAEVFNNCRVLIVVMRYEPAEIGFPILGIGK